MHTVPNAPTTIAAAFTIFISMGIVTSIRRAYLFFLSRSTISGRFPPPVPSTSWVISYMRVILSSMQMA
eukprot:379597-Ditylum_brightwellii.AAC.1